MVFHASMGRNHWDHTHTHTIRCAIFPKNRGRSSFQQLAHLCGPSFLGAASCLTLWEKAGESGDRVWLDVTLTDSSHDNGDRTTAANIQVVCQWSSFPCRYISGSFTVVLTAFAWWWEEGEKGNERIITALDGIIVRSASTREVCGVREASPENEMIQSENNDQMMIKYFLQKGKLKTVTSFWGQP